MNAKKLIKKIKQLFNRQYKKKAKERKKIALLLNQIKKKIRKLEHKISLERDQTQQKQYRIELEILHKQLEKGKSKLIEINSQLAEPPIKK